MALFFSGAVTTKLFIRVTPATRGTTFCNRETGLELGSRDAVEEKSLLMKLTDGSPIKRRLRHSCHSLDHSLLSPDSSYVCYSSPGGGAPSCCRRSPRLLTNGYYAVSEESFSWDEQGNVSLTPCEASVSYKENLVRVFRRRRRPRGSLARLLSDVTESCQSFLDHRVFRGVFGTAGRHRDRDQDQDQDQDWNQSRDQDQSSDRDQEEDRTCEAARGSRGDCSSLDESSWRRFNSTELSDCSFTYDPTEAPPPQDKMAPPPKLWIQEEICSEICQSKERFTQPLGGLSEVPPPSPLYCCCGGAGEPAGLTMKTVLVLFLCVFMAAALCSGCPWRSLSVASTVLVMAAAWMILTKSGPLGEWRRAKTEDITSRNE